MKVKNIQARVMRFRNFWQRDSTDCYVDVTLDAMWNIDASNSPFENSILLKKDRDQLKFRMLIESNDQSGCFPHRMQIDLTPRDILHQYTKTVYYTIFLLFSIVFSIGVNLG